MGEVMQKRRDRIAATALTAISGAPIEPNLAPGRRSTARFEEPPRREQAFGESSAARRRAITEAARPLVVDVDGTLIISDLLIESFLDLLSRHPVRERNNLHTPR